MSRNSLAAAFLAVVAVILAACGGGGGGGSASDSSGPPAPSASDIPSPVPHSGLDQPQPTPAGFPGDVPVYPGARLTAGASFSGSSEMTYGIDWETLDSIAKVQAFYASKLNQNGWSISFSGNTSANFSAVFSRTDNSQENGVVGADGSSGITKIHLSLVVPS